jgi:hypothetical protein
MQSFCPLEIRHAENQQCLRILDKQIVRHLEIRTCRESELHTYRAAEIQNFICPFGGRGRRSILP